MNKWVKLISSGVVAGVVTAVLLILSGLSTTSVLTSGGTSLTTTTVSLDVNVFALLMIVGVSLAVIIVNYVFYAVNKTP